MIEIFGWTVLTLLVIPVIIIAWVVTIEALKTFPFANKPKRKGKKS
jgi:hypothetical protein